MTSFEKTVFTIVFYGVQSTRNASRLNSIVWKTLLDGPLIYIMYSPYNFSATSPKSIMKVKVAISEKVNFLVKIFHCDCWLWFINYRTFSTTPSKHCFLTNSKLRNILCWGYALDVGGDITQFFQPFPSFTSRSRRTSISKMLGNLEK